MDPYHCGVENTTPSSVDEGQSICDERIAYFDETKGRCTLKLAESPDQAFQATIGNQFKVNWNPSVESSMVIDELDSKVIRNSGRLPERLPI